MEEDLSWKEEAQKKASKATRFLVKLIGRSPRSSDETSPSSSESEHSKVLKLSVKGKAHRSSQDHTISSSKQNSPPTQKTSKTRANKKSHDSHKLAGPQKVTTSKRGKAKASRTSPESSRSQGLQTEGVSRVGSPELPRGILKPLQSSKAPHSPPAANPDLSTSTDITYSLPVSNLMANANMKSDTDDHQMPDSSPQMDVMDTRDGVSELQLTLPLLMANTNVISENQEAEPQTEGTMVNETPGSNNSEKAESSTPSEKTSIGMKIIKFPRLVFGKTAAAGVVIGALPPPSQVVAMNNTLLTQYDKPKAKPTDRSKEEKTNGVASIPEEIGVGAKIKLNIVPTIPTFNMSETSHSVTDGSSVQGKIKDFFKTKLGIQEANKTPPIAKDTKRKGSFTESHRPNQQGVEQARGWDYSKKKASLSSNDQQRHIQAMSESDRLKPRVVTKRRGTIYCEDLQQRPNQQTPELDRFKPKDISRRRGTIYSEDLQQRPNLQMTEPEKDPLRPRDIPRRRGSISYNEYQKLNQQMPVTTINTEDLEEFLHSLGIDRIEDLATMVTDEPLTDAQVDAFKDVFEQFAENRHGFIHTESLTSSLDRVEISIGPEEVELALEKADYDEDGEVGFQDFLSLMTDNQRFSKCVKAQGADPSQSVEVWETLFYKALTKMLDAGILSTGTTAEIVQYYHQKTLRLIRKAVRPDGEDGGHVLTYYAQGAHLIGLKGKQLMKYMKPVETQSAQKAKDSPYLKRPSLHMGARSSHERRMSLPPAMMVKMGRMKSVKTWKTVKIEDRIRQLSIKHAGMETMEMITPVKIKVNMSMKERDRLTYNEINQIIQKSKSGVKGYLKALSQLKRRDTWNSWGSLQPYCVLHSNKDFPETFTTYSWSWSGCRNMMETGNLDVRSHSFPHNTHGQPLEPIDRKQHTSSNTASHKEKTLATPASRKSRTPNNTSQKSSPPTPAEMESSSTNNTEKKDPTTNTASQLVSPPTPTAKSSNTNANHNDEKYPIPLTSDDFDFDFDYDYDYEYDHARYYVIKKDRPPS